MILVPTYNERENIRRLLPQIFSLQPNVSVMVIDDNSPDGTADAVRRLQPAHGGLFLFEREKKEGLGRAYIAALRKVMEDFPEIEVIGTMDADWSHRPSELQSLLAAIKNYDCVIGSRYIPGGKISGWEKRRVWLSRAANGYCRLITSLPLSDVTSGFCCYRRSAIKKLVFSALDPTGYAFQIHLKYLLWRQGATFLEVPICFNRRQNGESKISLAVIMEGILIPWRLRWTKYISHT